MQGCAGERLPEHVVHHAAETALIRVRSLIVNEGRVVAEKRLVRRERQNDISRVVVHGALANGEIERPTRRVDLYARRG